MVIITLNEERNIGRCLDSLKELADEVIVLDSYSTDATEVICRSHPGLRFVQRQWEGYSASKNYANSLASQDYILSLDADEALSEELRASIVREKAIGFSGVYVLNRRTNYCGKWIRFSGWYPDYKVRLFPGDRAKWVGDFVHEELKYDADLEARKLEGHLLHYSYHTREDHRVRSEKYSLLSARKMHLQGKRVNKYSPWAHGISRFFSKYILKLGFLDGWAGWEIALISGYGSYMKYRFLYRLNRGEELVL